MKRKKLGRIIAMGLAISLFSNSSMSALAQSQDVALVEEITQQEDGTVFTKEDVPAEYDTADTAEPEESAETKNQAQGGSTGVPENMEKQTQGEPVEMPDAEESETKGIENSEA